MKVGTGVTYHSIHQTFTGSTTGVTETTMEIGTVFVERHARLLCKWMASRRL